MEQALLYYGCAAIAVIFFGLAKGGFVSLGALAMPVMALGVDPVRGAAIMLPVLILQDAVSVWAFRHSWDRHILKVMLPGMAVGVLLGYLLAAKLSEAAVLGVLGLISMIFGLHRLWIERGGAIVLPSNSPDWVGMLCGVGSGFTSQIAHAGAPPFQIWTVPKRLPRDILVGTTAVAFAVVNWIKVPTFIALGQFTRENLLASLVLMPLGMLSTYAGVWLIRRIDPARFYTIIYWLMVLLGIKLMADALLA